jgi:hypothetical protein
MRTSRVTYWPLMSVVRSKVQEPYSFGMIPPCTSESCNSVAERILDDDEAGVFRMYFAGRGRVRPTPFDLIAVC